MNRLPDPDRDLRISHDLGNWLEAGRQLTRRVALRLAETGDYQDTSCELLGAVGALVSQDGPAVLLVRLLKGGTQ